MKGLSRVLSGAVPVPRRAGHLVGACQLQVLIDMLCCARTNRFRLVRERPWSPREYPRSLSATCRADHSRRGVALRNRIAHASMTTRMGSNHRVTDQLIAYSENRAAGGCAMIVTEPLAVLRWQKDEGAKIRAYDDAELDGLKRWAAAVEAHDCRLLGQLQDAGRGKHHGSRKLYAYGPSSLPDDLSWTVPRALERGEIADMVAQFAAAAARLQRAGFCRRRDLRRSRPSAASISVAAFESPRRRVRRGDRKSDAPAA